MHPRAAITIAALALAACGRVDSEPSPRATAAYISALDLAAMQRRGTDFTNPRYDPARIGKPPHEIDRVRDYDFAALRAVQRELAEVDRDAAMEAIATRLCAGAVSDPERHVRLLTFLHRVGVHGGTLRPIEEDGGNVLDPLVHLELNEMRCGAVSRLAVDLFLAAGLEARCVLLGGHTVAEARYDGDWHYIDADGLAGNGMTLVDPDGTIPSWLELSANPERLDALPYRYELRVGGHPKTGGSPAHADACFFGDTARTQSYVHKAPRPWTGADYGWRRGIQTPVEWTLSARAPRFQPGTVKFRDIVFTGDTATLSWREATDRDGDLRGYRVYVGSTPRGWSYGQYSGNATTRGYWHDTGGWRPEMYDALFTLPPSDLGVIVTAEPRVEIPVGDDAVFVTVMAFDEYHERVGKRLYLMSNQLRLARPGEAGGR